MLRYNLNLRYDTNSQYKPRILFQEIVKLALHYCKTMTSRDYLIVFMGNENALRGLKITTNEINTLLTVAEKTNLIVVGFSFAYDRRVLNGLIYNNYQLIKDFLNEPNCAKSANYISLDCFMHVSERYYGTPRSPQKSCSVNLLVTLSTQGRVILLMSIELRLREG